MLLVMIMTYLDVTYTIIIIVLRIFSQSMFELERGGKTEK